MVLKERFMMRQTLQPNGFEGGYMMIRKTLKPICFKRKMIKMCKTLEWFKKAQTQPLNGFKRSGM